MPRFARHDTREPFRAQLGIRNQQAYNPRAPAAHGGERRVGETERNTVRRKVVEDTDATITKNHLENPR